MKKKFNFFISCLLAAFLLPFLLTFLLNGLGNSEEQLGLALTDALSDNKTTITMNYSVGSENIDIDDFITGMMVTAYNYSDNKEFLKAVAVMCRTYIKYCEDNNMDANAPFYTDEDMQNIWGDKWEEHKNVIKAQVISTSGQYIVSGEKVIFPYYHILTSGYTRNKEAEEDYLCQVVGTSDSLEENYISVVEFKNEEFCAIMKAHYSELDIDESSPGTEIQIISKTEGGYVVDIQIGNLIVKGEDIAKALSLPSPSFVVKESKDKLTFTVKGKGDGYGVSIHGAAEQADNGSSYKEILNFYYRNIQFVN